MRKLILIAGLVLSSAAAQAGDRSLSLAGSDEQTTAAPAAKANSAAQTSELPQAEAPKAEAPKYVERPAVVETKPDRYRDEPRYKDKPRYKDEPRYRDEPQSTDSRRSDDDGPRYERPRTRRSWTERRVINVLHRHGIYW